MDPGIQLEVSARVADFVFNESETKKLLTGTSGGVARDLTRRAISIESSAKRHATGRPGPNVQTGRLRGSITWRIGTDMRGLYADIGTSVHYAPFVEARYPFLVPALQEARV